MRISNNTKEQYAQMKDLINTNFRYNMSKYESYEFILNIINNKKFLKNLIKKVTIDFPIKQEKKIQFKDVNEILTNYQIFENNLTKIKIELEGVDEKYRFIKINYNDNSTRRLILTFNNKTNIDNPKFNQDQIMTIALEVFKHIVKLSEVNVLKTEFDKVYNIFSKRIKN